MRIACVHVPQFALQCVSRIDPSLRGAAVAVAGAGDPTGRAPQPPVIQACSRAAWALGVRVGMSATAARALSSELRVVTADPQLERDSVRAIADALLGLSPVVDVGGRVGPGGAHLAMYCEVPSRTRGASFGERLLERLARLGTFGRIGIADDRFTAWVAASQGGDARADDAGVVSVPRGGSAAFLAPRPLSLLAISPEVQHMLEALGVRTLGEFAALPAPSVSRPLEADYQALARGDTGHVLRPYAPDAPIREEAAIVQPARVGAPAHGTPGALSGPAAVALLAERIALRLAGRGRGAARLEVTLAGEAGERVAPILASAAALPVSEPHRVLESAEDLAEAIGDVAGDLGTVWRLRVAVTGEALAGDPPGEPAAEVARVADAGAGAAAMASLSTAAMPGERDALSVVLATTGSWQLTSPMLRASGSGDAAGALGSVTPGRRDAHRRTQRGKQRPRIRRTTPPVQPRLFKNQG